MPEDQKQYKKLPAPVLQQLFDHQRWLSSNGQFGERLNDSFVSFNHFNLDGVDLSGAKLYGADFAGCSLRGTHFIETNLLDSRFVSCDIEGANFAGAEISGVLFLDTDHTKAVNVIDNPNFSRVGFNEEDAERIAEEAVDEMIAWANAEAERPEPIKGKHAAEQPHKLRPGG